MQQQSDLAVAVGAAATQELNNALDRIRHCLGQLSDAEIWWRPSPAMNSIGNLILHLCGNVRQWILSGVGGAPDVRQRPTEFSEHGPIARADLLRRLEEAVEEAGKVLTRQSERQLLSIRTIQGFEVSVLEAIFNSVPHFRGHAQEIIHMTRHLRGDKYQFAWTPSTPAEGA